MESGLQLTLLFKTSSHETIYFITLYFFYDEQFYCTTYPKAATARKKLDGDNR